MSARLSRRHLFRLRPRDVAQLFRDAEEKGAESDEHPTYFRPPGALAKEPDFLSACERCGKCVEACPHDSIERLGVATGVAEGTPVLDPALRPMPLVPFHGLHSSLSHARVVLRPGTKRRAHRQGRPESGNMFDPARDDLRFLRDALPQRCARHHHEKSRSRLGRAALRGLRAVRLLLRITARLDHDRTVEER